MADDAASASTPAEGEPVEVVLNEDGEAVAGEAVDGENPEDAADAEPEGEVLVSYSLQVLTIVREAQKMHGLRHEDYERYRRYCAQRLQRIRKKLHYVSGKRNYNKRVLTPEHVTNERYLHIPLVLAERAWAYFMQLKEESKTDERKKYHALGRLRKANKHANDLKELVLENTICDERSRLEITAYASWMQATLFVETQKWNEAVDKFTESRLIYQKLGDACTEANRPLYLQRDEEIVANMRYCNFMVNGSEGQLDDLLKMRSDAKKQGGEGSSVINKLMEKLEASVLEKQQNATVVNSEEISWCEQTCTITNDKLRLHLAKAAGKEKEILKEQNYDTALELYDQLYGVYDDALSAVSTDVQKASDDDKRSELEFLKCFLTYKQLEQSIARTHRVATATAAALATQKQGKPDDLIRLFSIILEGLEDITDLDPVLGNPSLLKFAEGRSLAAKAHRCFYMAESYRTKDQLLEAFALLGRASQHARAAQAELAGSDENVKPATEELVVLLKTIRGRKCVIQARSFQKTQPDDEGTSEGAGAAKVVYDNLGSYEAGYELDPENANLVTFPPNFEVIPYKPLYFDLAGHTIDFHSLDARIKEHEDKKATEAGVSGMLGSAVSGLTSWFG